ncbi:MAG: hypothetical protein V4671_23010 [Armatimonadota bacterium]
MKYNTFVKLRGLIIAALCGLLFLGVWSGCRARQEANTPVSGTPVSPMENPSETPNRPAGEKSPPGPRKGGKPGKPAPVAGTSDFTDIHREILKMQKEPLSKGEDKGDSLRWVVSDAGIKAEFRSDKSKGSTTWNRVKIDYNNNKQYEEKWDFKPDGSIKRQVSPNDDNRYTEEYRLQGEKWVRK